MARYMSSTRTTLLCPLESREACTWRAWGWPAAISIVLTTAPAFAHHPFAPEFDWKKPVTLTGTVTKVEWTNPHIWFYVDVKDDSGKVTTWGFSGGPP